MSGPAGALPSTNTARSNRCTTSSRDAGRRRRVTRRKASGLRRPRTSPPDRRPGSAKAERTLATLSQRIATRRAEITEESWASETFAGLREIPVASQDRSFVSVRKEDLSRIAPRLAAEIPKKSHLWADWTVWNFRRRPVHRASAMPSAALRRTQASLAYFERLEVWHAGGMADPWLVGGVRLPSNRERFYLLYDWGTETTADREDLR